MLCTQRYHMLNWFRMQTFLLKLSFLIFPQYKVFNAFIYMLIDDKKHSDIISAPQAINLVKS